MRKDKVMKKRIIAAILCATTILSLTACDKKGGNTESSEITESKKTKVCKVCGKELPIEMFRKNIKSKDGYTDTCIDCINVKIRAGFNKKKDVQEKPKAEEPIRLEDTIKMVDAIKNTPDQALVNELRQRGYDVTCAKTIAL